MNNINNIALLYLEGDRRRVWNGREKAGHEQARMKTNLPFSLFQTKFIVEHFMEPFLYH